MLGPQLAHLLGGDGVRERAGRDSGNQHLLVGIQELRGLAHEIDRAEDDLPGRMIHRLAAQGVGVTDEVPDPVHDVRGLIRVSQDDRVLLLLQSVDLKGGGCDLLAILHVPAESLELFVEPPGLFGDFVSRDMHANTLRGKSGRAPPPFLCFDLMATGGSPPCSRSRFSRRPAPGRCRDRRQ